MRYRGFLMAAIASVLWLWLGCGCNCEVREELPLSFTGCPSSYSPPECLSLSGVHRSLRVLESRPHPVSPGVTTLVFQETTTATPLTLTLTVTLPEDVVVPIWAGEVLDVYVYRYEPWWTNLSLTVREPGGLLRLTMYDGELASYSDNVDSDIPRCRKRTGSCGKYGYPSVRVGAVVNAVLPIDSDSRVSARLRQGEQADVNAGTDSFRIVLAEAYVSLTMSCFDVPPGWARSAVINTSVQPPAP